MIVSDLPSLGRLLARRGLLRVEVSRTVRLFSTICGLPVISSTILLFECPSYYHQSKRSRENMDQVGDTRGSYERVPNAECHVLPLRTYIPVYVDRGYIVMLRPDEGGERTSKPF